MIQTISLDVKIAKDIISTLRELKEEVSSLNERLDVTPPYGSEQWWERSNTKALKSIKEGKGIVIRNKKELNEFFKSL